MKLWTKQREEESLLRISDGTDPLTALAALPREDESSDKSSSTIDLSLNTIVWVIATIVGAVALLLLILVCSGRDRSFLMDVALEQIKVRLMRFLIYPPGAYFKLAMLGQLISTTTNGFASVTYCIPDEFLELCLMT
jgi:hypothetical protein